MKRFILILSIKQNFSSQIHLIFLFLLPFILKKQTHKNHSFNFFCLIPFFQLFIQFFLLFIYFCKAFYLRTAIRFPFVKIFSPSLSNLTFWPLWIPSFSLIWRLFNKLSTFLHKRSVYNALFEFLRNRSKYCLRIELI